MRTTGLAILGYGALAAAVLACFWLVSLAPLRLGWGRELVGAVIAVVALVIGLRLTRAPQQRPDQAGDASEAPVSAVGGIASIITAGSANRGAGQSAAEAMSITPTDAAPELSQREYEVLRQLAEGLSNKEIARALSVSENTVKTHLANLYAKLGVSRRTEALKVARLRGVV